MATVYGRHGDLYERDNAYEVENLDVDQATEQIVSEDWIDGKVTTDKNVFGYGDNAVMFLIDGRPWMIIGD